MKPTAPSRGVSAEQLGRLSQWQLIRLRFVRHKLAVVALNVLIALYLLAAFVEFFAPYTPTWNDLRHVYAPPQLPRLSFRHGLHVRAVREHKDPVTLQRVYAEDAGDVIPLGFFVKGEPYKLWGLFRMDRHFIGVDRQAYRPPAVRAGPDASPADGRPATRRTAAPTTRPSTHPATSPATQPTTASATQPTTAPARPASGAPVPTFYLLGADKYGRDVLTRILYGARISLSVGIIGIGVTFVLGLIIGGVSGYLGGGVDNFIQRSIEIINAFPRLPLWLALGAIMPADWSAVRVYFGITVVLSLLGWTRLARVVRGKILSLREEDYAVAARLLGAGHGRVLFRHLLPGFTSHIIVAMTLSVPGMILGETSLSFLGLGLRPPVVSWGVMLQDARNIQAVANYPWLLLPAAFIILTVLSFNFLGDGLRDAADPYSAR